MRHTHFLLIVALAGLLVLPWSAAANAQPDSRNFRAHLTGDEEVADEPVITRAQGQAIFQLSKDGTELYYKLIVANIENVTMAHIHLAPVGENGPVVAWLYPAAPPPQLIEGRFSGVLAEGVITNDDVITLGDPDDPDFEGSLDALLAEMRAGNTYVNVHTEQYPAGEVRGQISVRGRLR